ncbi:uncharacterized protein [Palaemon carinicauda]|uniref:uncharacterized protein n=1 Tax=Palaemon carinicauda TaxID=392227 RepID=UPI0035B6741E
MLLLAFALITSTGRFSSALIQNAETEAVFTSGIDSIVSVLEEYVTRCSVRLSDEVEGDMRNLENTVEMQWKRIEELQENVTKAIGRSDDMIKHHYQVSPTPAPDPCAWPFRRVAGSCFWLHKNPSLTWEKARAYCQKEGGDLATPDDMGGVISFLNSELAHEWIFIWFGGKRKSNGSWYWLSGDQQMTVSSSHWSDYIKPGNCAFFHARKGNKIGVTDCNEESWYLCEKKIL